MKSNTRQLFNNVNLDNNTSIVIEKFDDDGKLIDEAVYFVDLHGLPAGNYDLIAIKTNSKKTISQMGYYWGIVLNDISSHTGYEPIAIHEYNKKHFGYRTTFIVNNESFESILGMKNYKKDETRLFIDKVIMFWTEQGVSIRPVELLTNLDYYETSEGVG